MACVLGIDQGSTKTLAALADENGTILGAGYAEGACHANQGMPTAMENVRKAVSSALAAANRSPDDIGVVAAGMTGADWPYEYGLLRAALLELYPDRDIIVENDCITALRSGTDLEKGAILCLGTGLNAAVINGEGKQYIYGYYVNEEDSGGEAIGRLALKAVFNAECGLGRSTRLTENVLTYYQLSHTDELMQLLTAQKLGDLKVLAPLVFSTAKNGDPEAMLLLEKLAVRIVRYVTTAAHRLGMSDHGFDVVLTGSIFKNDYQAFRQKVENTLGRDLVHAHIVRPMYEPIVGAVLKALDRIHGRRFPLSNPLLKESARKVNLLQNSK